MTRKTTRLFSAAALGILLLSFGPAVATASAENRGRGGFHGGFAHRRGFGHQGGFGRRGGFDFRGRDRFFSGRPAPFRSFHRPFAGFRSFPHGRFVRRFVAFPFPHWIWLSAYGPAGAYCDY